MGEQIEISQSVRAELTRLIIAAETVESYQNSTKRVYAYKILREAFPDIINRESWRIMSGKDPDITGTLTREQVAAERDQREREAQARANADRALLQQHGRPVCCDGCDEANARTLRRELGLPEWQPGVQEAPGDEEDDEDTPCNHREDGEADGAIMLRCRWCDGVPDEACDHDFSCRNCDICEADHNCSECGTDPNCDHRWQCSECNETVRF
jgi:hypothetical protein